MIIISWIYVEVVLDSSGQWIILLVLVVWHLFHIEDLQHQRRHTLKHRGKKIITWPEWATTQYSRQYIFLCESIDTVSAETSAVKVYQVNCRFSYFLMTGWQMNIVCFQRRASFDRRQRWRRGTAVFIKSAVCAVSLLAQWLNVYLFKFSPSMTSPQIKLSGCL